ncbi:MAG: PTS sugar transporter subunit IIA [Chlamydiota bacterium]|nr:PTS sugar transporter subunit IIA [Chlamydiota bacterium]
MDLTTKDVANLLNVSKATIEQWIIDGAIPCYRIDDQYRFSRIEIEDWVLKKQAQDSPFNDAGGQDVKSGGNQQFSLYRAIHKGDVLHQVPGKDKNEVIRNTMISVAKDLNLDADVLAEMLIDRENLQPTALGHGIGIPHTRDSFLNSLHDRVIIAFPEKPLEDYGALDGEPVHTLFFLFACNDKRHLHLLAKIAHLSNRESTREILKSKPNKVKLLEFIKEWESHIGAVLAKGKS